MDDTCENMDPMAPRQSAEENNYITRMQKIFPERLRDMCNMHLAFILDFSEGKLENLLSESDPTTKRKLGLTPMFKKKEKTDGLFGLPLTDEGVCLMMPLITFLKKLENVSKEGLFRKPGNGRKMRCLKDQLLACGPQIIIDAEVFGPHDVACVLKEFLRRLPEPLLTERHMEAHRQIRALGKHAETPAELEKYTAKKISALQLLMRLLPDPAQKMVKQLLNLLLKVTEQSETKMTAATLGTIFAPIFFLNRKAAATDVCEVVAETEVSVAFLIENAQELFDVPKELASDVMRHWKSLEQCSTDESVYDKYQIRKCLSGRTLNTNVCYIDRKASHCEDIAGNTQAELESLFAHVQSLPDTPHNVKLKKQIMKGTSTPTSSAKKHPRSKSIGASIRKRLPSLSRSKNRNSGVSAVGSASSSSSEDHTAVTPAMSDLLQSPATGRFSRPRHKRHRRVHASDSSDCTPPKIERRIIQPAYPKESAIPKNNDTSTNVNGSKSNDTSTNVNGPKSNLVPKNDTIPKNNIVKEACDNSAAQDVSKCEKTIEKLAHPMGANEMYTFSNSSKSCLKEMNTQDSSPSIKPPVPDCTALAEKEILYLPYQGASRIAVVHTPDSDKQKPVARIPPRRCNTPGTPIMPRSLLQLAHSSTLETSI